MDGWELRGASRPRSCSVQPHLRVAVCAAGACAAVSLPRKQPGCPCFCPQVEVAAHPLPAQPGGGAGAGRARRRWAPARRGDAATIWLWLALAGSCVCVALQPSGCACWLGRPGLQASSWRRHGWSRRARARTRRPGAPVRRGRWRGQRAACCAAVCRCLAGGSPQLAAATAPAPGPSTPAALCAQTPALFSMRFCRRV